MRILEIKAYTFEELSEEAKEKVIEKNRYINVDFWDWEHFVCDTFKEKYSDLFEITNIYFSGFYSQGDGAMFEYGGINEKLIDEFIAQLPLSPLRKKLVKEHLLFSGSGIHKGHYYNERSCSHNLNVYYSAIIDYGRHRNIITFIDELQLDYKHYIEERYIDLCQELCQSLEDEYEWHTSDEAIEERLIDYGYEYTEQGEVI